MLFIDASAYLSLLNPQDNNHAQALKLSRKYSQKKLITSQAVLGEVLTVGSMRFDKPKTLQFVEAVINSQTLIIIETPQLVKESFQIFSQVKSKNISWVDCYSQAIINQYQIETVFTFDKDFSKLNKVALT
jgi:predicted nucleic acid-binding protein